MFRLVVYAIGIVLRLKMINGCSELKFCPLQNVLYWNAKHHMKLLQILNINLFGFAIFSFGVSVNSVYVFEI